MTYKNKTPPIAWYDNGNVDSLFINSNVSKTTGSSLSFACITNTASADSSGVDIIRSTI
jgi:hypothetical protein